jgi:hypothetical protein
MDENVLEVINAYIDAYDVADPVVGRALEEAARGSNEAIADLGAVLVRTNLDSNQQRDVLRATNAAVDAQTALAHETYGSAIDQLSAAAALSPNGAVTLVGTGGSGVVYAPGTILNLVPAQAGAVLTATGFPLNSKVMVVEVTARNQDVDNDWMIVGGSAKWGTDPYSGFPNDASLVVWQQDATTRRPLSSIFTLTGPKEGSPIYFQIQVILHGPSPAPFGGVTLTLLDRRCPLPTSQQPYLHRLIEMARNGGLIDAVLKKTQAVLHRPQMKAGAGLSMKNKLSDALRLRTG